MTPRIVIEDLPNGYWQATIILPDGPERHGNGPTQSPTRINNPSVHGEPEC